MFIKTQKEYTHSYKDKKHARSLDFYSGTGQTRRQGVKVSHHKQSLADAGDVVTERHRGERMEGEVTYIFVVGCRIIDLLRNVMG